LGAGVLKGDNSNTVVDVWGTARHGGEGNLLLTEGVTGNLRLVVGAMTVSRQFTCVHDCALSDLALITTLANTAKGKEATGQVHLFKFDIFQGETVYVAGFGQKVNIGDNTSAIVDCIVSKEMAGKALEDNPAELTGWSCSRFFILSRDVDYGFSGGPIFDHNGYLLGMLVASVAAPGCFSMALRATYIADAVSLKFNMHSW
jgi:hypothetical protein